MAKREQRAGRGSAGSLLGAAAATPSPPGSPLSLGASPPHPSPAATRPWGGRGSSLAQLACLAVCICNVLIFLSVVSHALTSWGVAGPPAHLDPPAAAARGGAQAQQQRQQQHVAVGHAAPARAPGTASGTTPEDGGGRLRGSAAPKTPAPPTSAKAARTSTLPSASAAPPTPATQRAFFSHTVAAAEGHGGAASSSLSSPLPLPPPRNKQHQPAGAAATKALGQKIKDAAAAAGSMELVEEWVDVPTTESDPWTEFPNPNVTRRQHDWPIWWMAPFFDRTSFGKEAANLVLGMIRSGAVDAEDVWVGTTQGGCEYGVDASMPRRNFDDLDAANNRWNMSISAIVVCHSLPPFWARPKHKWETCFPCPPVGYTPAVTIGRAMAETDVYHPEFVRQCNRMDEVWVPSDFSRDVLIRSGVPEEKLRVVPIPVNTTAFSPEGLEPLPLPIGQLAFGRPRRAAQEVAGAALPAADALRVRKALARAYTGVAAAAAAARAAQTPAAALAANSGPVLPLHQLQFSFLGPADALRRRLLASFRGPVDGLKHLLAGSPAPGAGAGGAAGDAHRLAGGQAVPGGTSGAATHVAGPVAAERPVVLLSVFKWEMRKGWDVLLESYLTEFTADDNVELYIITRAFQAGADFIGDMRRWAEQRLQLSSDAQRARLPTLYVISHHLADHDYARMYKAADAFVIATRGEGWGMPISEAMAMGLPVVVTNWSGVTAFVDETTGYMVDYDLTKVPDGEPWWFLGARWATAKTSSLRQRMRDVFRDRREAAARGRRARQRMVDKYTPEKVGRQLAGEFQRLKALLRSGGCGAKCHNKTWVAPLGDRAKELYTGREDFHFHPRRNGKDHGVVIGGASG